MSSTVRYQFVQGLDVIMTVNNFPSLNDGDDKQEKVIKRIITAADVGTASGQLQYQGDGTHTGGAIMAVIPKGQNVLSVEYIVQRGVAAANGMVRYENLESKLPDPGESNAQFSFYVGVALDNTIRLIDVNFAAAPLAVGDNVILRVLIGNAQNPLDIMNP